MIPARLLDGVFLFDNSVLVEIVFVAGDDELDVFAREFVQLVHPLLDLHERVLIGDIVDQERR